MAEQMNLIQKLASIRRDLKNIEKKGRNSFQNYDYLRAEDIAGEMGDRLAAMNVILARRNLSFVQDVVVTKKDNGDERADVHVIVTLDYVFIDGDVDAKRMIGDEGIMYDHLVVASIGEGRDSGDKAVAKAMTNALKYALTQPLMMRVGDDPEADAPHDKPEIRKADNARINRGGMDDALASARKSLREKAARIIGSDEAGLAWLKEKGITGRTNDLKTLADASLELNGYTQQAENEDQDLNW